MAGKAPGRTSSSAVDVSDIKSVLQEHIANPEDVKYGEQMSGSVLVTSMLEAKKEMISALLVLIYPNQSLAQSLVVSALVELATEKEGVWHLAGAKASWAAKVAKRIRTMLRHICQAKARSPQPLWVAKVLTQYYNKFPDEMQVSTPKRSEMLTRPLREDYVFAWDEEMQVRVSAPHTFLFLQIVAACEAFAMAHTPPITAEPCTLYCLLGARVNLTRGGYVCWVVTTCMWTCMS